jgi:hypothetical protein
VEWIRDWALAVCFACVGCGLLLQFIPNSNLQSATRAAVNIFFLVCIIIPVVKLSPEDLQLTPEFSAEQGDYTRELTDLNRRMVQQQIVDALEPQLLAYLRELGVEKNISVNVNTAWGESISITSVDILLDFSYAQQAQRIETQLAEKFQLDFQVSCQGKGLFKKRIFKPRSESFERNGLLNGESCIAREAPHPVAQLYREQTQKNHPHGGGAVGHCADFSFRPYVGHGKRGSRKRPRHR